MPNWTQNLQYLLNFFVDSNCPLCQRPTSQEFCLDCARQLQRCRLPCPELLDHLPVFAWGVYGGILKRAIAALKYQNQPHLARPLGHWLAQAWLNSQFASMQLIVVPIPLHVDKLHQRGYNQSTLLAQSFCELTGLHLQKKGLQRIRDTEAQYRLSLSEREQNLAMAFALGSGFCYHRPASPVLLLDDVYTTGATAKSAIKTLHQSGIQVHGLAAIATSQRMRS